MEALAIEALKVIMDTIHDLAVDIERPQDVEPGPIDPVAHAARIKHLAWVVSEAIEMWKREQSR